MKIGITIPYASVNYSGGVNVQCRMWQDGLRLLGHESDLLTPWEKYDYESYDFFFIVGLGKLVSDYIKLFKQFSHPRVISAPIIDPNETPLWKFKMKSHVYGSRRLGWEKVLHEFYMSRDDFSLFLARSEFEKKYIVEGLCVPEKKVKIVPLPVRFMERHALSLKEREPICLHVSRLASPNKNVRRLVEAAKKYNFKLRLAGTLNGEKEKSWLRTLIADSPNIEYLGWLDEKTLKEEYLKAKVFALPSLNEGVGMVAMEAACYGCEICITEVGGPKEYYNGQAVLLNPYDIDDIGRAVLRAMNQKKAQPQLSIYIQNHYSMENCMKKLESYLECLMGNKTENENTCSR